MKIVKLEGLETTVATAVRLQSLAELIHTLMGAGVQPVETDAGLLLVPVGRKGQWFFHVDPATTSAVLRWK